MMSSDMWKKIEARDFSTTSYPQGHGNGVRANLSEASKNRIIELAKTKSRKDIARAYRVTISVIDDILKNAD